MADRLEYWFKYWFFLALLAVALGCVAAIGFIWKPQSQAAAAGRIVTMVIASFVALGALLVWSRPALENTFCRKPSDLADG
jgi:hypothetical protein